MKLEMEKNDLTQKLVKLSSKLARFKLDDHLSSGNYIKTLPTVPSINLNSRRSRGRPSIFAWYCRFCHYKATHKFHLLRHWDQNHLRKSKTISWIRRKTFYDSRSAHERTITCPLQPCSIPLNGEIRSLEDHLRGREAHSVEDKLEIGFDMF